MTESFQLFHENLPNLNLTFDRSTFSPSSDNRLAVVAVLEREGSRRVEMRVDEHAEESNGAKDTITHSIDINATCNIYIHKILHTQLLAGRDLATILHGILSKHW